MTALTIATGASARTRKEATMNITVDGLVLAAICLIAGMLLMAYADRQEISELRDRIRTLNKQLERDGKDTEMDTSRG